MRFSKRFTNKILCTEMPNTYRNEELPSSHSDTNSVNRNIPSWELHCWMQSCGCWEENVGMMLTALSVAYKTPVEAELLKMHLIRLRLICDADDVSSYREGDWNFIQFWTYRSYSILKSTFSRGRSGKKLCTRYTSFLVLANFPFWGG